MLAYWVAGALPVLADTTIEDFSQGLAAWKTEMPYGDVGWTQFKLAPQPGGRQALQADFDFRGASTNHLLYVRPVDLDLSGAGSVMFDVKGVGDRALLFLFLHDSKGRFRNYGPHGSNPDFHTGYADWHRCTVILESDRSCQGGDADLADIKRIGVFVWSQGPARGTAWIANLSCKLYAEPKLLVTPPAISPNGDGVHDAATITARGPEGCRVTVELQEAVDKPVACLINDQPLEKGLCRLVWDGRVGTGLARDGRYTLKASFTGTKVAESVAELVIDTSHLWPPIRYTAKPFFPIGVWFEGAPSNAKYPADPAGAKQYYDRCFADLKAHGFNCAVVPNCPEKLWGPLLQSAQEHGIDIVLEVAPLVGLVGRREVLAESEVYSAVKRVVDTIGSYPSLLRYQIIDEPPLEAIPNWVLVQRVLAAVDPTRPVFSCCCSDSSLARMTEVTTVSEAVWDNYPLRQSTPLQSLGGFVAIVDRFKAASRGNRMWAVLQAFAIGQNPGSWRYPTPEELRAQTYVSLAAGCQGIFYFLYSHMPGYLDGMVGADGAVQPVYAPTSQLAQELGRLAALLLSLTPRDAKVALDGEARVGCFADGKGRDVLIVASLRPDSAISVRLTLGSERRLRDALTGETFKTEERVLRVSLPPGAGRVLTGE